MTDDTLGRQPPRPSARVTVVIATYNRTAPLEHAIRGVQFQTVDDWRMIIVGDCCGPETAQMIARFGDARITYVNLPDRCGEQALPNAVGVALADTEFVAFLNHDDLWLPDHLELGLTALETSGADFYASTAIFVRDMDSAAQGYVPYAYSPPDRTLAQAFWRPFYYLEPVSTWVLRREKALAVGPMRPAAHLHRIPVEDWALRAWRAGLIFVNGNTITVLKDNSETAGAPAGGYSAGRVALKPAFQRLTEISPDAFRAELLALDAWGRTQDVRRRDFKTQPGNKPRRIASALTAEAADIFLATGEDAFDAYSDAAGFQRGSHLTASLARRTGEELRSPPDLASLITYARRVSRG